MISKECKQFVYYSLGTYLKSVDSSKTVNTMLFIKQQTTGLTNNLNSCWMNYVGPHVH